MPAQEFGRLPTDLRAMTPRLRRSLRRNLKAVAEPIAADARSRASWSTRIPGAISVTTGISRGAQVVIRFRVSAAAAPHARAYEGLSSRGGVGFFRHPVYGTDRWVSQQTKPFIEPALRAGRDDALRALDEAIQSAARDTGFH